MLLKSRCRARWEGFSWFRIFLHVLLSSKGRRGCIVATGPASRTELFASCLSSSLIALPCCWGPSCLLAQGSSRRQVLTCTSAHLSSQARPEALMRQKGIWVWIKSPGVSESLNRLVWLNYFLFDSEVLLNQSPTKKLLSGLSFGRK